MIFYVSLHYKNQTNMKQFKEHKIGVQDLLSLIPDNLIDKLAKDTNVDYYTKVLNGKSMFYLLLYGIIENDKLSQRSLEDTFNDPFFKIVFQLDKLKTVRHSSISERLSKINSDFFRQIYNNVYTEFSKHYSQKECEVYNNIRVDSSIVTDTSGRMKEGLAQCNQTKKKKLAIKFTTGYDGIFPSDVKVFDETKYNSEDVAMPELIENHVRKINGVPNIYVIDRGLQSLTNMDSFSESNITFISRLKKNRKYKELRSNITDETEMDFEGLELLNDSVVNLYYGKKISNTNKDKQEPNEYRLIIVRRKKDDECFWFLTNEFNMSAREIAANYKRRWDIEVFFRFIKQELNASHLVSLNKNGIEIILYMTMIASMLIMIYKKVNELGFTTAKRRFKMELRNEIVAIIVKVTGGDFDKFLATHPNFILGKRSSS